jgi:quercetin dioxygenase-like cupin family protein
MRTDHQSSIKSILAGAIAFSLCSISTAYAQDAVVADPEHYKVEFENDQVRVLRITYGPGEKSVMHEHPNSVAVFLTDIQAQFTFPDGNTDARSSEAGQARWTPATKHLPENTGTAPFEVILVEIK